MYVYSILLCATILYCNPACVDMCVHVWICGCVTTCVSILMCERMCMCVCTESTLLFHPVFTSFCSSILQLYSNRHCVYVSPRSTLMMHLVPSMATWTSPLSLLVTAALSTHPGNPASLQFPHGQEMPTMVSQVGKRSTLNLPLLIGEPISLKYSTVVPCT